MGYQTFKFYTARIGVSLLLMGTLGFFMLYFLHEIAMPGVLFNDDMVQWALILVCLFFGFFAYGLIGEQVLVNAEQRLKDIDLQADEDLVIRQFERLMAFTYSSFFLPYYGQKYRERIVIDYASYLLRIGCEEPFAMPIYLKAYLQDPADDRFRLPLISLLERGIALSSREIDLLLVMLKVNDYRETFLVHHLAALFLAKKRFSLKYEPVYLKAVETRCPEAQAIVDFVIPLLVGKQRADVYAIQFYLAALPYPMEDKIQVLKIVGGSYCRERYKISNPDLHARCGEVFDSLEAMWQQEILESLELNKVSSRWKKMRWFGPEEREKLEGLLVRLGIVRSWKELLRDGLFSVGRFIRGTFKWFVLKTLDVLVYLSRQGLSFKLLALGLSLVLIVGAVVFWMPVPEQVAPTPPPPPVTSVEKKAPVKADQIYIVQVAAVTTQKQADRLLNQIERIKIGKAYVVKTPRSSGGYWYKIRVGTFPDKQEAERVARQLVQKKVVRNYFLISRPKKDEKAPPTQ